MTTHARQPLGGLDFSRLNHLSSMKNTQNAIKIHEDSSMKNTLASPCKKRRSPSSFDDPFDSENIDPSLFSSPTKRSKNIDGTPVKAPKFILSDILSFSAFKPTSSFSTPLSEKRKPALSVSLPATTNATPISRSRGSPKREHKRIGLLKGRRTSGSPNGFRRIDPPSFYKAAGSSSGTGLPFSIDAALSGTISTYTPKQQAVVEPAKEEMAAQVEQMEAPLAEVLADVKPLEEAMPKSWFFDIHEDTPEEEAANLMEHSALCLDISSDDDEDTRRQNLEKDIGKENVPPPDFVNNARALRGSARAAAVEKRMVEEDAMEQDRKALGNLNAADHYDEGLDETSIILVAEDDGGEGASQENIPQEVHAAEENAPQGIVARDQAALVVVQDPTAPAKPSGLSHELKLEATPEAEVVGEPEQQAEAELLPELKKVDSVTDITIWVDELVATESESMGADA